MLGLNGRGRRNIFTTPSLLSVSLPNQHRALDPFFDFGTPLSLADEFDKVSQVLEECSRCNPLLEGPGGLLSKRAIHVPRNTVREDENTWQFVMNVKGYNPDEFKVKLDGKNLTLEGVKEVKSEDGSEFSKSAFCKSFTIPENVNLETMKSEFGEEGLLTVTAEKVKPAIKDERKIKEIPITRGS